MSRQVWKGSTLLNPEPPVLVSCGSPDKPNLITVGWTGTICTQPPMLSISVRPERYSHHLIQESGEFVVNLPTESLVRAIDWCGVKSGRDVDKFAAMHLTAAPAAKVGTVLLEDLGNLTANELYNPAGAGDAAAEHILQGLDVLAAQCENLIVVSNEVFSGGADYAGDTDRYLLALAQVNNALAARADAVVRVVCGIPVYYKGVEK